MEQIRNSQEEMYSVKKLFTLPNLLKKFIKIQKSRFQKVWYLNVTNLAHISVLWGNARIIYKFTIGSTDFLGKTKKNTTYIKLLVVSLNIIAVLHQNDVLFIIENKIQESIQLQGQLSDYYTGNKNDISIMTTQRQVQLKNKQKNKSNMTKLVFLA